MYSFELAYINDFDLADSNPNDDHLHFPRVLVIWDRTLHVWHILSPDMTKATTCKYMYYLVTKK